MPNVEKICKKTLKNRDILFDFFTFNIRKIFPYLPIFEVGYNSHSPIFKLYSAESFLIY